MRSDIDLDDKLKDSAGQAPVSKPADEAAEQSMPALLQLRQQLEIRKFRGKLQWQGDLDQIKPGQATAFPPAPE